MLLFRDPDSGRPFFEGVALEIDYDNLGAEAGSLDFERGMLDVASGFPAEVALFDPATFELIGIARIVVSDRFYRSFRDDLKHSQFLELAAILVVLARLFVGATPFYGQATTLVAVLFLGGVQLITLGIIGEYLGRIYDEVKGRPLYLVRETLGFEEGDEATS